MNGLQRILHKAIGGFGSTSNLTWRINGAGEWVYQRGSTAYIDGGYKALPNVYSIISAIAGKAASVPFEIYKVKDKAKYRKYKSTLSNAKTVRDFSGTIKLKAESIEKVEGSEVEQLLLNPNSYQSYEQLMWEILGYKLLTGNSVVYGLTLVEGGKPKELHNIPSPLVELIVKGTPFEPIFQYKTAYLKESLPGEDVMHFRYWNPISDGSRNAEKYWGQSPLQSCENLLGRYRDADITQGFQFKNMGPAGMISGGSTNPDTNLTEEQAISVQDRFDQQHKGTYKAGSILVTPSNLKWTAFGLSPVDLNIDGSKEDIAMELSNAYHYPIAMISKKNATENNMIEARKAVITDCVIPELESIKGVLQHKLLPKFGEDLVIEYDYSIFSEMQEDLSKLAEVYDKMWWTSANEKRAATGYDRLELPEADTIYGKSSMIPLQDLGMGEIEMIDETKL